MESFEGATMNTCAMSTSKRSCRWIASLALGLCLTLPIWGQSKEKDKEVEGGPMETCPPVVPLSQQEAARAELREQAGDLHVTYRADLGTPRTLYNPTGFLTKALPFGDAKELTDNFLKANAEVLGLLNEDFDGIEVTDSYRSEATGISHFYFQQTHAGLALHNGQLQVHMNAEGRILSLNSDFVPGLAKKAETPKPALEAAEAVHLTLLGLGIKTESPPKVRKKPSGLNQQTTLSSEKISKSDIEPHLVWFSPPDSCQVKLAWSFSIEPLEGKHLYDQLVDATTGELLWRQDRVLRDLYAAFPQPLENPDRGAWAPVLNPAAPGPSPFGWHDVNGMAGADFLTMQGNNAHAYLDPQNLDRPTSPEPACAAGQICSFRLDLSLEFGSHLSSNSNAALSNAFYWTNLAHDLSALYGFDEAAGNLQAINLRSAGSGGDHLQLEVHDSASVGFIQNAFFTSAPEGTSPRLELPLWSCPTCTPSFRDSALDNGVILHEYAHGISQRLIGGPSNVSCLSQNQQAGEGISDIFALLLTHEERHDGDDSRGLANYLLGEPSTGPGIRLQPYSTDPSLNTGTYETIHGRSSIHAIGEVWAQAVWRAYWAMIDRYGFDPNLHDAQGGAGNQRMLLYVIQGLALTTCNPTFADLRDGIIQAAIANNNGADVCLLWNAFAEFGLGIDADAAGPNSTRVRNGFSPASDCRCTQTPPGLVSWWALDQPEVDLAYDQADLDLGIHGTLQGDPRPGRGLVGLGMVFDGDEDSIEALGGSAFNGFEETGFTLEGWIMPERALPPNGSQLIWHFGTRGTSGESIMLSRNGDNGLTVTFFDSGAARSFSTAASTLDINRWSHIALTFLGPPRDNRIWVNGQQVASDRGPFDLGNDRNGLRLAGDSATNIPFFEGRMDEVAIYRGARSESEIQAIADAYKAGRCKSYCGRPKTSYARVVQMYRSTGPANGGFGPDLFFGSPGPDDIASNNGRDCIYGFGGDDTLFGRRDRDTIFGGPGEDTIEGNEDNDEIFGGPGDDFIRGRRGADTLAGGPDDDTIEGNDGDDRIHGNEGDDTLLGHRGGDTIFGGPGNDIIEGNDGADTIDGGEGNDIADGGSGIDRILGGPGRDKIYGGSRGDTLEGGSGRDFLHGQRGADILRGEDHNDRLCGGSGGDTLEGGLGTDEFRGGSGNDTEIEVETSVDSDRCNAAAFDAW